MHCGCRCMCNCGAAFGGATMSPLAPTVIQLTPGGANIKMDDWYR